MTSPVVARTKQRDDLSQTARPFSARDIAVDRDQPPIYGALDLGTNNCRLLVARPSRRGFVVLDSFSRIIRLGEGLGASGALSEAAMARTIQALRICASKMRRNSVSRARLVATQACRMASNGAEFVERVQRQTGLELEVLSQENEARLAVAGCATLLDRDCDMALVFDIGGGSSELVWLDLSGRGDGPSIGTRGALSEARMVAWTSLPVGVVTLAERFDGRAVTPQSFEAMVADVLVALEPFERQYGMRERIRDSRVHFLGTSGTVTTVAGIRLQLPRYDRRQVDGCWLATEDAREVTARLLAQSYEQRCAEPCIGRERADLVLAGCAILEALLRLWPTERLRVADRGLREGILSTLMAEDGFPRSSRRRSRRRGRSA
ncbi:MAG: Ppx/GppA phosphatase family protein [Pseudomonadota bacterium]